MTSGRRDGKGTPFGEHVRNNPRILSSYEGLVVDDIDWIFHRYLPKVDGLGTRLVRMMMDIELKCFGREPDDSQRETLFIHHQLLASKRKVVGIRGEHVVSWHFGQYFLQLPEDVPAPGMRWGCFTPAGAICWAQIDQATFEGLVNFEHRPDNPSVLLDLRRHHKNTVICNTEMTELGFTAESVIFRRS
jgi:hypothetical protein